MIRLRCEACGFHALVLDELELHDAALMHDAAALTGACGLLMLSPVSGSAGTPPGSSGPGSDAAE